MKAFDIIGVAVVAAWVAFSGVYIYRAQQNAGDDEQASNAHFKMHSGDSWLVLRRQDKEAGFIHQSRTRVSDGWFFEQDIFIGLEMPEEVYIFGGTLRFRLDDEGRLIKFTGELSSHDELARVEGHVQNGRLRLSTSDQDNNKTETSIRLDEPPRLTLTLANELVAQARESAPDERLMTRFDPFALKMREVKVLYDGPREVDVYEETLKSEHYIEQGERIKYDHFINDRGEALIQTFPFRLVGAQVPAALGRSRTAAIRRQAETRREELEKKAPDAAQDGKESAESSATESALTLSQALEVLGGHQPWAGDGDSAAPIQDELLPEVATDKDTED